MPVLESQKDLQSCSRLPFCYLCGKEFGVEEKPSRDHVPPKAVFAVRDRNCPLILPVHFKCNQQESIGDEVIGQLVAVSYRTYPKRERLRLKFGFTSLGNSGNVVGFLRGHNLKPVIWRFVKGFHAALYGEFLEVDGKANVHLPFPEGRKEGSKIVFEPILPQQVIITKQVKKNRLAGTLDRIVCYSGKCVYECTWVRADAGEWLYLFGLRLYNWERLGDTHNFPARGCVGLYCPINGRPRLGTIGTSLQFPYPGTNPLDPFN